MEVMKRFVLFLALIGVCVVKGEATTPEKTAAPAKDELATAKQREAILRARLKVTETLSRINEIKVQMQDEIEKLQKQSTAEFRTYQTLVEQAGKACTTDETFDPDLIACKPKVQAKAKAEK